MSSDNATDKTGFYSDNDLAYMRSLSAAVVQRSPKHLLKVIAVMVLVFICAVFWMAWAEIDVVVRGAGRVIPARQVQLIQNLEGGVVSEILVKEGDIVDTNQPLLKISDVAFSSSYQENLLQYYGLRAKSIRLQAEAHGESFQSDIEMEKSAPDLLKSEQSLFESNFRQLKETLSIYSEQVSQQQSALEEAESKARQLKKTLSLLQQEIKIKEPLMHRRIISEIDFLQLQQREAEVVGELEIASISIPRLKSTIEEARGKLEQSRLDFQNKAKKELNETLAEMSRISETQNALQDRVIRTTMRSPVKGVVKRLYANTVGGVIKPGGEVLEIVPLGDSLLVEVHIKPADIAYINNGQETRIKFTAYDFAIYGSLKGKVTFVSADTITDEEGNSFYVARVIPERSYLGHKSRKMPIKVGMTSEADIITDKKTILEYILKPIHRGLGKALRES